MTFYRCQSLLINCTSLINLSNPFSIDRWEISDLVFHSQHLIIVSIQHSVIWLTNYSLSFCIMRIWILQIVQLDAKINQLKATKTELIKNKCLFTKGILLYLCNKNKVLCVANWQQIIILLHTQKFINEYCVSHCV